MKIKELHKDIERYLLHDCYCPHEVYSFDGFFCQLVYEDQECEKLGKNLSDTLQFIACSTYSGRPQEEKTKPIIVLFFFKHDKCVDALRYDATDNNIEITKMLCEKGIEYFKKSGKQFDEYEKGSTAKSLNEILSLCNGFVIRD